jgi:hypothetical protein
MRKLFAVAVLAACRPSPAPAPTAPAPQPTQPYSSIEFPSEWSHRSSANAVGGTNGVVTSDAALASQVGIEILRAGGNAVDAAVATGFALAVVYPEAGNLGGGGFTVVRMADGRVAAIDFREVAPLGATRDMFLDDSGRVTQKSVVGPLASGVPGSVAGLVATHQRFGTLPLARVVAPAIRMAADGFVVVGTRSSSVSLAAPRFFFPTDSHSRSVPCSVSRRSRGRFARSLTAVPRPFTPAHSREWSPRIFGRSEVSSRRRTSRTTGWNGENRSAPCTAVTRC